MNQEQVAGVRKSRAFSHERFKDEVSLMRITKMLGVALLFFTWTMLGPVFQSSAYFAKDSFAPFWDQGIQSGISPAGQPAQDPVKHFGAGTTIRVARRMS